RRGDGDGAALPASGTEQAHKPVESRVGRVGLGDVHEALAVADVNLVTALAPYVEVRALARRHRDLAGDDAHDDAVDVLEVDRQGILHHLAVHGTLLASRTHDISRFRKWSRQLRRRAVSRTAHAA